MVSNRGLLGVKIDDPNFFEAYNQMMRMNVDSTLLSTYLASQLLKNQGTLILTGAQSVYKTPVPDILSYALAKNMVHSIAHNLSKVSPFKDQASLITILPKAIDTPANREWMPEKDWPTLQSPDAMADIMFMWLEGSNRPASGSFVEFEKQKGGSLNFKVC